MVKHSAKKPGEDARKYVLRILSQKFRSLQLFPGQRIQLGDTAKTLNVSRTPVHEAFATLERQNLLVTESRKSILVAPLNSLRIQESIWMHHTTTTGLMEELYSLPIKQKKLNKLTRALSELDNALKEKNIDLLPKLRETYFFHLYELANLTEVYSFLEFGTADLQRLLCLENSIDSWINLVFNYHKIHQGLSSHLYELTKEAVLEECNEISNILLSAQQTHPELFEK